MSDDMQKQTMTGAPVRPSRRRLIERAGLGAVALGAVAAGAGRITPAQAQTADIDVGILNFALNLEYLEGEFYSFGVHGHGLGALANTAGKKGAIKGGAQVPDMVPQVLQLFQEIAQDERNHVKFLVDALGTSAVAEPAIDFTDAFAALGQAIGVPGFNPFADQLSFLLGAYIFEDVGVTAYNGAAPLVTSKTYLGAAASILAVEAYHASAIRTLLYEAGAGEITDRISKVRAAASGTGGATGIPADDQGVIRNGKVNAVPTNSSSLAFSRTPYQVLAIVFNGGTTSGGFFPDGVDGLFTSSVA